MKLKDTIELIIRANTINSKAISTLDSDWEAIKAQENLILLLYEYHSITEELINKIGNMRKELRRLNERVNELRKNEDNNK